MAASPSKKLRPLSPHLQIYKPQITSGLSIFHRMTGIGLSFGLVVFVGWLVALAKGPDAYAAYLHCAHGIVGQVVLFGLMWAFFFHLCTGIRHLLWDAGYLLEIKQVYRSGYFVLLLSTLLTIAMIYKLIWCHP